MTDDFKGYRQLACAVIVQALRDAVGPQPAMRHEAFDWLSSPEASLWWDTSDFICPSTSRLKQLLQDPEKRRALSTARKGGRRVQEQQE